MSSLPVSTLGVPRIGPRRELKTALESFWAGKLTQTQLKEAAAGLRAASWARQHALGVTVMPSNDFSLYDHVLDTAAMVGAVPAVYGPVRDGISLEVYFAMARGSQAHSWDHTCAGHEQTELDDGVPALEMTKWFDTNYHYMVPEFDKGQRFKLTSSKVLDEYKEAKALGYATRPVLVGPVTFLKLGKSKDASVEPLSLLDGLLPIYAQVLTALAAEGADWVQIDEPILALDLDQPSRDALSRAYAYLAEKAPLRLMLTSYFGGLGDNLDLATSLPVTGLHLDLVRDPGQVKAVLAKAPADRVLSLGVVDGRNIWRADLSAILDRLEPVVREHDLSRFEIAASCSMLHVPIDLDIETSLDPDLKSWLAFSVQKMSELVAIARALGEGRQAVADAIEDPDRAALSRRTSDKVHDAKVADRMSRVTADQARRKSAFDIRRDAQRRSLDLPLFPTTTIGSFPQTSAVRQARAAHAKGAITDADYDVFLKQETEKAVRWQEEIGLDVLVHGEFERNDMVQYFGEQLAGFAFTKTAWVQSYGSRYVRPPIIFGDVSRPKPMTVEWSRYAQSLTDKPMKGMLTGPVTMLQWSFVRDDIPRADVCRQIALALRDEVTDLEAAGIRAIQMDEPALREGLPLRRDDWAAYLNWAVECFRVAVAGVKDETQVHTHMCYAEFNDILDSIGALDADVISIETSRSKMELLRAFGSYRYPNEIGPGVYDIHSPRVPTVVEMIDLIDKATRDLAPEQIWVNPDCGLKTRGWDEVKPALSNMIAAARTLRTRRAKAAE